MFFVKNNEIKLTFLTKYGILRYIFIRFGALYMDIIKLSVGDVAEMKKKHPCGSSSFRVLRVGSDVRVVCIGCGRDVTLERIKFEKSIKKLIKASESVEKND